MIRRIIKNTAHFLFPIISTPLKRKINYTEEDVQNARSILEDFFPDITSSCIKSKSSGQTGKIRMDLNIVIPAYNVEKYLSTCLESVFCQQTEYKFRIIVVDDGSIDNTGVIADRTKTSHDNLIVIHQTNKGLSCARNAALEIIDSRYVMFIDSDDYLLESNAIQLLLSEAYKYNADIVQGGFKECNEKGCINSATFGAYAGKLSVDGLHGFAWGKVIRSDIFDQVRFPPGYLYEDSVMRHIIYSKAKIIRGVDRALYAYRNNPKSLTRSNRKQRNRLDALWITLQLYSDRKELGIEESLVYYEFLLRMAKLISSRVSRLPKEIQKAVFIVYADFIKKSAFLGKSEDNAQMEYALKNGCYYLYRLWGCL